MMALDPLIDAALGDGNDAVEEHILSCGACADTFERLLQLGPALAQLVRAGQASMPATRALVDRLQSAGLITRNYVLAPDSVVPCTVGAADIYTLTTYEVDLAGVERLDAERLGQRAQDIPFDAPTGRVYFVSRADQLRMLPTMAIPLRLVAVSPGGEERVLLSATLQHTAFAG